MKDIIKPISLALIQLFQFLLSVLMAFYAFFAFKAFTGNIQGMKVDFNLMGWQFNTDPSHGIWNALFFLSFFCYLGAYLVGSWLLERLIKSR
ncbi:hypothetical protein [Echinicola sp. 20G]|uniref:hypothetical protein n=1 Tax=Echinicola sp. 20G TaxID=2781961 RepID=UPI001910B3D8|nr:hypothetical protein [Echinicola sp. 20G]